MREIRWKTFVGKTGKKCLQENEGDDETLMKRRSRNADERTSEQVLTK